MEQSSSWEANRSSASQEIPAFNGTQKFITAFISARHLSPSSSCFKMFDVSCDRQKRVPVSRTSKHSPDVFWRIKLKLTSQQTEAQNVTVTTLAMRREFRFKPSLN